MFDFLITCRICSNLNLLSVQIFRLYLESTTYMCESFVEGLFRMSVPQSKVAVQPGLNVLYWCTSEACKYSISAIVMVAVMTSCSSAILCIERFTSTFARKIYEH